MTKAIESAILQELKRGQPLKARVIARNTSLPVGAVNSALYGVLREKVQKNDSHEWTLRGVAPQKLISGDKTTADVAASKPRFSIKSHVVKEK